MQVRLEPPSHCPSPEQGPASHEGVSADPLPVGVHPVPASVGSDQGRSAPLDFFSFLHLAQSFVWLQLFETKPLPPSGCPMAQGWLGLVMVKALGALLWFPTCSLQWFVK